MNPFNVLRSVFQYLRGLSNPVPTQGGGGGLLWMLAYLAWVNSGRSSRRRRRTRSRSCIYNRDSFSDTEQGSSVEKMDTILEVDKHRAQSPLPNSTAGIIRSPSSITNAQVYARNIIQAVKGNMSESNTSNSGSDDLDPLELVNLVTKSKKGQFRNSSEESYQPSPSRRRNKVALKRLQKKTGRQLKKRDDTEELKGRRNKKYEHGAKSSSNRRMNTDSSHSYRNM